MEAEVVQTISLGSNRPGIGYLPDLDGLHGYHALFELKSKVPFCFHIDLYESMASYMGGYVRISSDRQNCDLALISF